MPGSILLLSLLGCPEPSTGDDAAHLARLDALEEENLALTARLIALESSCVTEPWVEQQGFLTEDALGQLGYASSGDLGAVEQRVDALERTAESHDAGIDALGDLVTAFQEDYAEAGTTLADLAVEVDGLARDLATAESDVRALRTDLSNLDADVSGLYADVSDLATELDALGADVDTLSGEAVRLVAADETVAVTSAAELTAALDALDATRIAAGATVTIQLAAGSYAFTAPIEVRHPDGANVRLVGDVADPSQVEFAFTGCDGVLLRDGHALGYLGGVTLRGDLVTTDASGVHVSGGATLALGPLEVQEFGDAGLLAEGGAVVEADEDVVAGGYASGWLALTQNAGDGLRAEGGAVVDVSGAVATGNAGSGFAARWGSFVDAGGATAAGNGSAGFVADDFAVLRADGALSSTHVYGYHVGGLSWLSVVSAGSDTNTWSLAQGSFGAADATSHAFLEGSASRVYAAGGNDEDYVVGN